MNVGGKRISYLVNEQKSFFLMAGVQLSTTKLCWDDHYLLLLKLNNTFIFIGEQGAR